MAAPRGNTFWKIRSKHGRDKLFDTPQLLREAAYEYFEWCDKHPLEQNDFVGKDAIEVIIKKKRVYTLHGLCTYIGANVNYWTQFKQTPAGRSIDFSLIVQEIEGIIYNQKMTGAASGFFNANIIARDLGLADKQETRHDIAPTTQIDYSKLSQSALDEIARASEPERLTTPANGFDRPIPIEPPATPAKRVQPDPDEWDLI